MSVACSADKPENLEIENLRLLEVDRVARLGDPCNSSSGNISGRRFDHMWRGQLVLLADDEQSGHLHLGELGAAGPLPMPARRNQGEAD